MRVHLQRNEEANSKDITTYRKKERSLEFSIRSKQETQGHRTTGLYKISKSFGTITSFFKNRRLYATKKERRTTEPIVRGNSYVSCNTVRVVSVGGRDLGTLPQASSVFSPFGRSSTWFGHRDLPHTLLLRTHATWPVPRYCDDIPAKRGRQEGCGRLITLSVLTGTVLLVGARSPLHLFGDARVTSATRSRKS